MTARTNSSTQEAPATYSIVERSAIMAGIQSPTSNMSNSDNNDAIAEELVGNADATTARAVYVGRTKVTGVSLNKDTTSIVALGTEQLTATITPGAPTIATKTFTSSNTDVATVSSTGLVTALAAGDKASGTLTITDNFAENSTVTIGTVTYRFKGTTAAAYDINIGATAAESLDFLKAAVNASGTGDGSDYHTGTLIHPKVTATTNTDTTQLFVAKLEGLEGNAIVTTETSATASFGAAKLTGGTASTAIITVTTDDLGFTDTCFVQVTAA